MSPGDENQGAAGVATATTVSGSSEGKSGESAFAREIGTGLGAVAAGGGGGGGNASGKVEGGQGEKPAVTGRTAPGLEGEKMGGDGENDDGDDDDDLKPAFLRKRQKR